MKNKYIQTQCIRPVLRTLHRRGIPIVLVGAYVWCITGAVQASSWSPTLLVNTESFQVIDDGDGTTDIEVRFGTTIDEKLRWMINEKRFEFSRDLRVAGNITATGAIAASGSITAEGAFSGASLHVSGETTMSGTLSVEGATTFGSTIEFNGVTYTFPPSDGTTSGWVLKTDSSGTLSWAADSNTTLSTTDLDARYVNTSGDTMTGSLDVSATASGWIVHAQDRMTSSGTLTVEGIAQFDTTVTITEGALTDSTIVSADIKDGEVGAGDIGANAVQLSELDVSDVSDDIAADIAEGELADSIIVSADIKDGEVKVADLESADFGDWTCNGTTCTLDTIYTTETSGDARYVNVSGDTMTGDLVLQSANLITSGATVTANLAASGTLSVEGASSLQGAVTFGSTTTLNSVTYTWPSADGSRGEVLTTDSSGNLTWSGAHLGLGSGGVVSLSPEYPHSVYFNSGSVTNDIGQLSYSYDETNNENYYRWDTTKSTLQEYWISARVRVPDNFSKWDTVRPIQLRYRTGSGLTTANFISMRLYDTGGSEVTLTSGNQLANTSWTTATITGPDSSGTYTTGSHITVAVKFAGTNPSDTSDNGWVDAGFINLNWETTAP